MNHASGTLKTRLLFFVTEDWYFCSHRLSLAKAAADAGYDVVVVTRVRAHGDQIRQAGLSLIPFENDRHSLNPLAALWTLVRLVAVYRRLRPTIAHHVAISPVLYGSIAARVTRTPHTVNALAGMGWLFSESFGIAGWLKPLVRRTLIFLMRSSITLVQNGDDARLLETLGVPADRIKVVPGSGVDLVAFTPRPHADGLPMVVLPARLLWDKGVGEFVSAARLLRERGVLAKFVLAGEPDHQNPAAIPADQVAAWVHEGVIEHVGWVADMPALLASAQIVCLPSYREGLPKSLIEAAAAGLPIVTTDVPGCRDVVTDGDNGLLLPARDVEHLADALGRLIANPALRAQMGARGRVRAEREFGTNVIIPRVLALYAEALA